MGRMISSIFIAVAMLGIGASGALAAGETATSTTEIKPNGQLSKTQPDPVRLHLEGKVSPGPGEAKVRPLINVKLNLPTDLSFWPAGTKPCKKDIGQKNPVNANRPTAAVIADCPKSVVGDGTAVINIAGLVSAPVTDPVLTIFNGGKDGKGHPKLLIHGYSATVVPGGHGIIMTGKLVNGVMDVSVPQLAANSAVTEFAFDFPGKTGLDPRFVRAKCSSGKWNSNAVLTLADSNPNTGGYINKSFLATTPTMQKCVGKAGGGNNNGGGGNNNGDKKKGKFSKPKVSGPDTVRRGQRRTYFVKVKNVGNKTIKRVKVTAGGKGASGKGSLGKLKRGQARKIKVKVRFRKRGRIKLRIKVNGRGAKARAGKVGVRVTKKKTVGPPPFVGRG